MTHAQHVAAEVEGWPRLPVDEWTDTRDTVHMWTQVVGKIRWRPHP
jgi:uncharacterized protein DUF5996